MSGVTPVQVPPPPPAAVGGGWVPMVGRPTPGRLLPAGAPNTPGSAPSPFHVVVQPGGGATGPSPPPGYRRRHRAGQPQVRWCNLVMWLRHRWSGGTGQEEPGHSDPSLGGRSGTDQIGGKGWLSTITRGESKGPPQGQPPGKPGNRDVVSSKCRGRHLTSWLKAAGSPSSCPP